MARSSRLLEIIRDAADAFGTTQPDTLFKNARMKRPALVRALGDLARGGLVEIDRESGAVSLTVSGRAELFAHSPTLGPNVGRPYQPADYALAPAGARPPAAQPAALGPGLGSAPHPPLALAQQAVTSRTGDMTRATASAAVEQARDTASAVVRRQAAKKASAAATQSTLRIKAATPVRKSGVRKLAAPKVATTRRARPRRKTP